MRVSVGLSAIAGMTLILGTTRQLEAIPYYPWCRPYGSGTYCYYMTREQCQNSTANGRDSCFRNPEDPPLKNQPPRRGPKAPSR